MKILQGTPEDLEQRPYIVNQAQQMLDDSILAGEDNITMGRAEIEEAFREKKCFYAYDEERQECVGFAFLEEKEIEGKEDFLAIEPIVISRALRGKKIGSALFKAFVKSVTNDDRFAGKPILGFMTNPISYLLAQSLSKKEYNVREIEPEEMYERFGLDAIEMTEGTYSYLKVEKKATRSLSPWKNISKIVNLRTGDSEIDMIITKKTPQQKKQGR